MRSNESVANGRWDRHADSRGRGERTRAPTPMLGMLAALLVGGVLAGCATPAPLVRLNPRASDVFWIAGRAAVQKQEAGVRVAVAFEHQEGPFLGVRVEVENQTDGPLDVKPQDFSYLTCSGEGVATCSAAKPLIDPEQILASLDVTESRERAGATNEQAAMVPLMLLGVAGDVAHVASGHASQSTGTRTLAVADQVEINAAHHDRTAAVIDSQREQWSNAAFRRNTLPPGGGVSGYVYIPTETNVRYLWLTVRAGNRRFPFCFEQVVTRIPTAGADDHQGGIF